MSKVTRQQLRRMILEETASMRAPRKRSLASFIFEDKDTPNVDPATVSAEFAKFKQLDNVDPTLAKALVKAGTMDKDKADDVLAVESKTWAAADLKPSQTTMRIDNTVGMVIAMLNGEMDNNLGCIVSSDNHIMDGHHRWSAAVIIDPASQVSGYGANLPGEQLLGVLNVLTKGVFGRNKGNPGKGAIADYTPENIKAALQKAVNEGVKGRKKPEEVKEILEKKFGSVEKALETMSQNVTSMSQEVPSWAPDRIQMPVIDPKEVPKAAKIMNAGQVDFKPPFASVTQRAFSGDKKSKEATSNESYSQDDGGYVMERWQKLAGLIKG